MNDIDCAAVVYDYIHVVADGGEDPYQQVADGRGISVREVYALVARARRRGFISSYGYGRPGGRLTTKGREAVALARDLRGWRTII